MKHNIWNIFKKLSEKIVGFIIKNFCHSKKSDEKLNNVLFYHIHTFSKTSFVLRSIWQMYSQLYITLPFEWWNAVVLCALSRVTTESYVLYAVHLVSKNSE